MRTFLWSRPQSVKRPKVAQAEMLEKFKDASNELADPMLRNSAPAVLLAALLAGCSTSQPATAGKADIRSSLRPIVGTTLIGAKGATPADQGKIDDTAAGLCGAGVWTRFGVCEARPMTDPGAWMLYTVLVCIVVLVATVFS
jgi:hypothetical protein